MPKVREVINVDNRWEEDIEHDPRSVEIYEFLSEYDSRFNDNGFGWKCGGDGDSGEDLMYHLDEYFACKDLEEGEK